MFKIRRQSCFPAIMLSLLAFSFSASAVPPHIDLQFYDDLESLGNYYWADDEGRSFVEIAINTGQYERALRLLDRDALNHLDPQFPLSSVFMAAFYSTNTKVIEKIIEIAKRDRTVDQLPLTEALYVAIDSGFIENAELLERVGASYVDMAVRYPEYLAWLILEDRMDAAWVLISKGFPLNSVYVDGKSVLAMAVVKQNQEVVGYLLERGVDQTVVDSSGVSALGVAVSLAVGKSDPDFKIIDMLVENGSDPCDKSLKVFSGPEASNGVMTIQELVSGSANANFLAKFAKYDCGFTN